MSITGNKGEWSEPYVLLKLLGDKILHLGDENLRIISDFVYPIVKIIRHEGQVKTEFSYDRDIVVIRYNTEALRIPLINFITIAKELFVKIKSSKGSFAYPEIESFLNSINVYNPKASSADKSDITIQIHDVKTLMEPTLGFSIKSQLGRASTLVNASGATNFTYRVIGKYIEQSKIDSINNTVAFSEKFALLHEFGYRLELLKVDNEVFKLNLQTIDTHFHEIMSFLMLEYYANSETEQNTVANLVKKITSINPLQYNLDHKHNMYEMKMKKFLTDYALGMRASKVWNGQYDATGGYIIVKNDGELVFYHFYYKNQFENYLLTNTKFDTGSTSKHSFGEVYLDGDTYCIKLNLQIRFLA